MEVMYRNNFDGYASCYTFLDDGFDSVPLFYSEDPETGFYHTFQNPMWVEEKPQIILFSDFLNWYEPVDYKKTLDWLFYNKEISIGKKLGFPGAHTSFQVAETKIKTTYLIRMDETTFCHDVIVIASLLAHYGSRTIPVTEWYRFRTIRSVFNDLCGELNVSIYSPSDNIKGRTLLNCLAPDFGFGNAGIQGKDRFVR